MAKYCIARNGKSFFHIVTHQYADETVRYAASELQKYLLKSTNAVVPYFSDRCPKQGAEIRERIYLDLSIECMHKHRYVKDHTNEYCLYYIMQ